MSNRLSKVFLSLLLLSAVSCVKPETDGGTPSLSLEIDLSEISENSVSVEVVPSDNGISYLLKCAEQEVLASYDNDYKLYLNDYIDSLISVGGGSRQEVVSAISHKGVYSETFSDLSPETGYVVFAVGVTDEGQYIGNAVSEEFVTEEVSEEKPELPSDMFTIGVSDITSGTVRVSVKPEDMQMTYYYDVALASDYDQVGGDVSVFVNELIDFIIADNGGGISREDAVKAIIVSGENSDIIPNLPAGSEFVAFAIGLDEGGIFTTKGVVEYFETVEAGTPQDCRFSFEYPQTGSDYAYVSVIPTDNTVRYFASIVKMSEFVDDDILADRVYESIILAADTYQISVQEAVEALTYVGYSTELHTELTDNTSYYAFAYAMGSDAMPEGDVFKGEFRTSGIGLSDCSVSLTNIRWYDGNELADMDSQYEGIRGGALFMADVEASENSALWYLSLTSGDMTDPETFPDETVISALMAASSANPQSVRYAVYYGESTALGFSMDSDGVYGDIYRELINITKEGASPVDEFIMKENIRLQASTCGHRDILNKRMTYRQINSNLR